jgi:hypothetical protein
VAEHVFVGQVLQRLWQRGRRDIELLRAEFDAGGYDIVIECGQVTRHIQLKTLNTSGKRAHFDLRVRLQARPSGCAVVLVVSSALDLDHFLWFGGLPGQPLPDITDMKPAKHSKGGANGVKAERPDLRLVPRRHFKKIDTIDDLLVRLFGSHS